MIENFKVKVSGQEIVDHAINRRVFHKEKADWYDKQIEEFKKQQESLPSEMQNTSNNAGYSFEQSAKKHRKKEQYFDFISTHIQSDETYQLEEYTLQQLEFVEA